MRILGIVAALAMLSGCGIIYTAPNVSDGSVFGDSDTNYDVQIVKLTPETTIAANLEEYVPQRLPLAFQPASVDLASKTANTQSAGDRFPPQLGSTPYRLGVGDVVLLAINAGATLENLPDLITAQSKRQGFIVQDDGAIAVPDVGRVRISDLQLADAEAEVFQAMLAAGIDPQFTMEIAEFNSQRVSVGGEVGNPSLVPITLKPLFLHEAVQLAGGARPDTPSAARVQLIRGNQRYSIPLARLNSDPRAQKIMLRDGDSVFVGSENGLGAEAERALFKDRLELGAVDRHYAYVTGEIRVSRKFELPFERKATLAEMLFDNTLLSIQSADYEEIYIIRANTNPAEAGGIVAYNLDASNAVNLALAGQFQLRHNDVVFIAEQPITSWNRVVSQLLPNLFLSTANIVATGL